MTYEEQLQMLIDKSEGVSPYSWDELIDELGVDISSTTLRKSWNNLFGGYSVMKYLEDKDIASSPDELKDLKDELYKERVKLYDQRREYNKLLREEARFDHLKDLMLERMKNLPEIAFKEKSKNVTLDTEAVLLCTDWHYGLQADSTKNYYDTEVCKERVAQLTRKTIEYCVNNKVGKLNVLLGGDMLSGIIQQSSRCEQEEDVVQQLMDVSEIISRMLIELENNVPNIKVYSVFGNHGRVIADKKQSLNRENLERLIPAFIRNRTGLSIGDSHGEDYIEFHVKGKRCVLCHGDKDSFNNFTINYTRLLGYPPDIIYAGHTHAYHEYDDCGTEIVVGGSLMGADDYAISLRKTTKPCQVLQIFGEDVCTYKLTFE